MRCSERDQQGVQDHRDAAYAPHGLRRRRGSLRYHRTGSLAEVAELLGDSKRIAAEHYVYAMTDYREADYTIAPARLQASVVTHGAGPVQDRTGIGLITPTKGG